MTLPLLEFFKKLDPTINSPLAIIFFLLLSNIATWLLGIRLRLYSKIPALNKVFPCISSPSKTMQFVLLDWSEWKSLPSPKVVNSIWPVENLNTPNFSWVFKSFKSILFEDLLWIVFRPLEIILIPAPWPNWKSKIFINFLVHVFE